MPQMTNKSSQNIKEGLEGHAVDWYHEVFDIVFPNLDAKAVNGLWKKALREPERKEPAKKNKKAKERDEDDDDEDSDDD